MSASCPGRQRTCEWCVRTLVPFISALPCLAQDIEPRRWSHLPLGSNFAGVAYAYTEGDIFFNPVLRIEDGEFEMHTAAFKYIHAFELLEKSARIDSNTSTLLNCLKNQPVSTLFKCIKAVPGAV